MKLRALKKQAILNEAHDAPYDVRRVARGYYWRGWGVTEIAREMGLKVSTVQSWHDRDEWAKAAIITRIEDVLDARLTMLIAKEQKSGGDYKEIDLLGRQIERFARVRRYEQPGGHEGDLNPNVANRNKDKKKKPTNNLINAEDASKIVAAFRGGLFNYQLDWAGSGSHRTRFLLKSRQIGATYYFAREAFVRGLETGNNQIFLSASRSQANIFRQYIVEFVYAATGVMLTGDQMVIQRGEDEAGEAIDPFTLYFLGTNYKTAQSYHGDVHIDEAFWIYGFEQLYKVAAPMAGQTRYRRTIFSTPSTINHEAYPMWNGERFNRKRPKDQRVKIDISHADLKSGLLGADGIYRQIVTIEDALAGGCNLFDLDELRLENSTDEFDNLFMCGFIDDAKSSFPMGLLKPCLVDAWEKWRDFKPFGARPLGDQEVWLGYDPSQSADGDQASLVVVAPPMSKVGKFRVLEKHQYRGLGFEQQAKAIEALTKKYRVTEIAVDATGMGAAVLQLVSKFFPRVRRIDYSVQVKTQMVLKAKNVFENKRIELDLGWSDLQRALLSIHPKLTKGQTQITYVARRSAETGHGDLAWALLHVLYLEPLDHADGGVKKSIVEFC